MENHDSNPWTVCEGRADLWEQDGSNSRSDGQWLRKASKSSKHFVAMDYQRTVIHNQALKLPRFNTKANSFPSKIFFLLKSAGYSFGTISPLVFMFTLYLILSTWEWSWRLENGHAVKFCPGSTPLWSWFWVLKNLKHWIPKDPLWYALWNLSLDFRGNSSVPEFSTGTYRLFEEKA